MKVHCNLPRTVGRTCQRTEAATGADRSDQACRSEYRRSDCPSPAASPPWRSHIGSVPVRVVPGGLAVLRVSLLGGEPTVAIVNGFYRPDARQHRRVPFSDYSTERFRFRPSGHRVGSRSARPGFRHPEVLEAKLVQPDRVQVSICRYSDDRITSKFQCVMVAYYASYQ